MTRAGFEFSPKVKDQAAARAKGHCERCGLPFNGARPEYDHILPIALKGEATLANCMVLCRACHKEKTAADIGSIRKADRQRKSGNGAKQRSSRRLQGPSFPQSSKRKAHPMPALPPRSLYEATHD